MSKSDFDIQGYLSEGVEVILKDAMMATLKNPKESVYLLKFSKHAKRANRIRQDHNKKGRNIPAFLIASITSSCNLHCTGCYSRANDACSDEDPTDQLSASQWDDIFRQAKEIGVSFIVLAGGEPMMRQDVITKAGKYPEILFPIFTNGTLMNDYYLKLFDDNRNLVPVLSIEGNEDITDSRRGRGVYSQLIKSMKMMKSKNIIFGASLTFTKDNLTTILSRGYIDELHDLGCKVVFFIEYVPMNAETVYMAPGESERQLLFGEIDSLRREYRDMIFLSFPGDEKLSDGCLAAGRGFFHINSHGGAEPCPASPYSDTNVCESSLIEALDSNLFKSLRNSDILIDEHDGGCVLFEHKDDVEEILRKNAKI